MTHLSLNETARRHNVSKAGLSQAVHADRPIKGMSLHRFAVVEDGEIQGFEFPDWYSIPENNDREEEETVFMTPQELCQAHSPFSKEKIQEGVRLNRPVDGFPVAEWAVYGDNGSWKGFEVPESVVLDSLQSPSRREQNETVNLEITAADRSLTGPVSVTVVLEDKVVLLRLRGRGIDEEYTLEEARALRDCLSRALSAAEDAHA
jgi:hypothetical protein